MSTPTLTVPQLARELGRSIDWVHDHWRTEVEAKRLPPPLHTTPPLVWSAAQVFARLDRTLTPDERIAAAAFRAARDAAAIAALPRTTGDDDPVAVAEWTRRLNDRFITRRRSP